MPEAWRVDRGDSAAISAPVGQYLILYLLFWVVRINGCVRRGRQPLLRGEEWFFDVPVPTGFYSGAGRKLLHRYWMRMLIPFALDIPIALAIFLSGRFLLLNWLMLGLCALIHINHSFSVDLAERQARRFAARDTARPVALLALSLKPRRLRDYTNRKLEWALALSSLFALAWLVRYYFAAPEHRHPRVVFWLPACFLYLQFGLWLVKRMIVAWRSPVPQVQAAEHLQAREETRRHYFMVCDLHRAAVAAGILFWPLVISTPPAGLNRLFSTWFAAWMIVGVAATIWVEIKRRQLVRLSLRARPVTLPDFLHQSGVRWPLCYQPSAPMLVLKGAHGYSLNLAHSFAYFGIAYLLGLVALYALLPAGH